VLALFALATVSKISSDGLNPSRTNCYRKDSETAAARAIKSVIP
jgi:hypothetical protein